MNDIVLAQARALYTTIQSLKNSILVRNAGVNVGLECVAKELTLPQMSTLAVIRDRGEMSLKELAEATKVSPPSASAMVDRLVDLGVLRREPSQVDRREVRVFLSETGEEAVLAMQGQMLQALVDLLEKLGPEDARRWCALYARIQTILDEDYQTRETAATGARALRNSL